MFIIILLTMILLIALITLIALKEYKQEKCLIATLILISIVSISLNAVFETQKYCAKQILLNKKLPYEAYYEDKEDGTRSIRFRRTKWQ